MLPANNLQKHARHHVGLILALAGLISAATLVLGPANLASAQAVAASWSYTGNLNVARWVFTATLLPSGKVLVEGGSSGDDAQDGAELYDPITGRWGSTGSLKVGRVDHTATLLPNGMVLIAGGYDYDYDSLNSAELYDSATATWNLTGSLNTARIGHTATLLPNGKVLVVGGYPEEVRDAIPLSLAELYDPATGTWSSTGSLNTARMSHTATLLPNGKVLVAAGLGYCTSQRWCPLNSAELYDPATGTWSSTANLITAGGGITATLLPNGKLLVAGGEGNCTSQRCFALDSAELYDSTSGTWSSTANLITAGAGTATLLTDGKVLVVSQDTAELYDPATAKWSSTANPNKAYGPATLLPNGKVLVVSYDTAELYDPGTDPIPNQVDDAQFFVRQQYRDFLNREPDVPGLAHWAGEITACDDQSKRQPGESLAMCIERQRTNTSAAFFLSPEFQYTGYFVYRLYKGSLIQNGAGRPPTYQEFLRDFGQVRNGIIQNNQLSAAAIEQNKKTFAEEFTKRAEFRSLYDPLSNFDYVEQLFQTTGINASATEKQALVNGLNNQTETRASVLQKVVDGTVVLTEGNQQFTTPYGQAFYQKEFNSAFVLMEYFGYLRRDPDAPGYQHWLDKLNLYGNFNDAEMVKSFITSPEYRARFGQP